MTITIQQEDITQAHKELDERRLGHGRLGLETCCVVYQALKRLKIPVSTVGLSTTFYGPGPKKLVSHTPELRQIVWLSVKDWPKALGMSFEWKAGNGDMVPFESQ